MKYQEIRDKAKIVIRKAEKENWGQFGKKLK